ncbi:MAG TPA: SWIM zinc finger family protein, partial [Spirochaetia bacterium]|nr:SWIM zinc finger family protein [Spirochaetia bacterium]
MPLFDARTIGRGIDYYLNGRVLETRSEGTRVTAAVAGTRAKPYTVMIDTRRIERSACTCPVGRSCKHLVAVVLSLWNDAQTKPAIRIPVTRFAEESGLLRELDDELAGGSELTIDLEAQIRGAATRETSPPSVPDRYLESQADGKWRLALIVDVDHRGRPQIALVRQYRRRDGAYGRVETYRGHEPVSVPNASARKLGERLRVLGGFAPVIAFASEIAATRLPVFAGSGPVLSGAQNAPVKVIRPTRFDLAVVPVASERRSVGGGRRSDVAMALTLKMEVAARGSGYSITPGSRCAVDEGLGYAVASFAHDDGLLLISDEASPLSALCRAGFSSAFTPNAAGELRSLATRYPDSVSVRVPRRVRVTERSATPVFTLTPHPSGFSTRLELKEDDETDGYTGDEYLVFVRRRRPPHSAIVAASELIGSPPREERHPGSRHSDAPTLWVWEEPTSHGVSDVLTVARELTELGYTVYISTPNGKRLVRRAQPLSVSISSGTDWFAPTVAE